MQTQWRTTYLQRHLSISIGSDLDEKKATIFGIWFHFHEQTQKLRDPTTSHLHRRQTQPPPSPALRSQNRIVPPFNPSAPNIQSLWSIPLHRNRNRPSRSGHEQGMGSCSMQGRQWRCFSSICCSLERKATFEIFKYVPSISRPSWCSWIWDLK